MAGKSVLSRAAKAKEDEFYTQLSDIENEMRHYRAHFKGKTVFCNCDDPFESNFFKYFVLNFNKLKLKKLIATCYDGSPIANQQLSLFDVLGLDAVQDEGKRGKPYKAVVTTVHDTTGNGGIDMLDVKNLFKNGENQLTELEGNGDFRSKECVALMDEADIVVTNPPFSLFREYVAQLMKHDKKFIIIGSKNAITYKEIFPYIMNLKLWLGYGFANGNSYFKIPPENARAFANGVYDPEKGLVHFRNVTWFTNLDIKKRHEEMILVRKYEGHESDYPKYDNYDAIDVSKTSDIPEDYAGLMGVPITFLDKYSPDQFDIVGIAKAGAGDMTLRTKIYPRQVQISKTGKESLVTKLNDGPALKVKEPPENSTYYRIDDDIFVQVYARILIRNKHPRGAFDCFPLNPNETDKGALNAD